MLLAILALGFLIVVHEAGHLFVARWCKMRVERFSIGFGPGILKRKAKSGTIYQLAPIPFGGFVEIRGMNLAEEVEPDDVAAYPNRPAWQRFVTILAGPATNYLSAIVLAFFLYTCHGMTGTTLHVAELDPQYDAHGKLEVNDRIIALDGTNVVSPRKSLSELVNAKNGQPVTLTVARGKSQLDIKLQPKLATDKDGKQILVNDKPTWRIGVIQQLDVVDVGIGAALQGALVYPIDQTKLILGGLRDIFTGKEDADPGGPVRIFKEFKTAFEAGWVPGIKLLMLLSVYLGLFNLFPLPALDGGRLVFLGYEMVTRRRANPKIETMVHMGGILVLLVVMVLVTLHDFNVI